MTTSPAPAEVSPTANTLLVGGIYDEKSLGFAVAEAWLRRDGGHEVITTVRSDKAIRFAESLPAAHEGRLHHVEVDWTSSSDIEEFEAFLRSYHNAETSDTDPDPNDSPRRLAGIVHSIAGGVDADSFSLPAHQVNPELYASALDVTALSLLRMVRSAKDYVTPGGGVVTFGFGEAGEVVKGYGGPMSFAKAALSQLITELGVSLGEDDGHLRTLEIVSGFVPTHSGRAVTVANRERPNKVSERFTQDTPLTGADHKAQTAALGEMAVSFMIDPAFATTTGERIHVDGGWSRSAGSITN